MEGLFGSEYARRKRSPPSVRRLIVDLKADYPGFNADVIANACYVRFGGKPAHQAVRSGLAEGPAPSRIMRRFPPPREIAGPAECRRAVVALHAECQQAPLASAKAEAGHPRMRRSTEHPGPRSRVTP